jgi:NTE family protein
VRASVSLPIVFEPVVIDGDRLVDGGLAANVPVGYARAAGAERVIVSDVSEGLADTLGLAGSAPPVRVMSHLVSLLGSQPADSLGPEDALLRMELKGYALLDFSDANVAALVAEGRQAASAAFGGALPPARPRRAAAGAAAHHDRHRSRGSDQPTR